MDATIAGKRFWVVQLKRFVLCLLIVASAAICWERFFLEPYERNGVYAGFIAILIYLIASFSIAIVDGLGGLAYLKLFGGTDMRESALTALRSARLPGPGPHQAKRFDYLAELADDETFEPAIRVRAGALYAAYQVAIERAGFFGGLALAEALNEATLRYSAEAPKRRR